MKKWIVFSSIVALALSMQSCKEKELVEVEVTEPAEQKEVMGDPAAVVAEGKFQMEGLPYAYNSLEPYIDAKTVEIHYSKHHLGYANNLNKAIAGTDLESKTIEEILTGLDLENKAVRNNAGGYYNHNLYWKILSGSPSSPSGKLLEKINSQFGNYENLKTQLYDAATKHFGSGWAWMVVDKSGNLQVGTTANQDNPLMPNMSISGQPILGLDVWEHAYYLNYQNQRALYVEALFNIINWDVVGKLYDEYTAAK